MNGERRTQWRARVKQGREENRKGRNKDGAMLLYTSIHSRRKRNTRETRLRPRMMYRIACDAVEKDRIEGGRLVKVSWVTEDNRSEDKSLVTEEKRQT